MVYSVPSLLSMVYREKKLSIDEGAEQFSVILALLSMLVGICVNLQRKIEHKFRNRTLCFLSTTYIISCIIIAISAIAFPNDIAIPIVLLLCVIQYIIRAIWWVLEEKYQKNFTTPEQRSKVSFTYAFFAQIGISILVVLGGILIEVVNTPNALLLLGLISMAVITLVLDYMRKRIGLKPEQYEKSEINFEEVK